MQTVVGYHRPESLAEAHALLSRGNLRSAILAGGTALNAVESTEPLEVIDLQALGLSRIEVEGSTVTIGAMVRLFELAEDPAVPELVRSLVRREGPETFRNAATVGGTLAVGHAESELVAGCLVFDGEVTLASAGGSTRTVGLPELLGDRESLEGSIITSLRLATDGIGIADRTGRTPADSSIVAVIARRTDSGEIRLALTGMATTPILVSPEVVPTIEPPGDFRGSAGYRKYLAAILTHRVIEKLGELV